MAPPNGDYLPLVSPDDHEDREETERRTSSVSNRFVLILAGVAAVASAANFVAQRQPQDTVSKAAPASMSERITAAKAKPSMHFTVNTEYGETKYGVAHPWIDDQPVVEPYRITTLTATGPELDGDEKMRWTIEGVEEILYGSSVVFTLAKTGTYSVTLSKITDEGEVLSSYSTEIFCLYVKRELRQMNNEDRVNFLNAAATLWQLSTDEGRATYGSQYTGMDTFVEVHAKRSTGDVKCDHWHEGTGFITHHLALSLSFEAALRAVDPRVTTPYWDFSIDGETIAENEGGPADMTKTNNFFTELWFGETDTLSHVKNGRWAHASVVMKKDGASVTNSFGIVRAPWNNSPDLELGRHMSDVCGLEPVNKPIPTCATHWNVMNLTDFASFQLEIAGYGHGPMHVNTGGVYGECTGKMTHFYEKWSEAMDKVVTLDEIDQNVLDMFGVDPMWHSDDPATEMFTIKALVEKGFHLEYFHIYRMLWRSQTCAKDGKPFALECPEECGSEVSQSDCLCQCKGVNTPEFDWENLEPCMYASNSTKMMFESTIPEAIRKDMVTTICSAGVKEGEQLESASPLDPIFWMIHPILDRLLMAKRLSGESDITFGAFGNVHPFTDTEWYEYSYYTTDEFTCLGHGAQDQALEGLPLLGTMESLADVDGDGVVSNIEFYNAIDPTVYALDYVYDNYEWNHCQDTERTTDAVLSTYDSMTPPHKRNSQEASVMKLLLDNTDKKKSSEKKCITHDSEKECVHDHELCFWIPGKDAHCASRGSCKKYKDKKGCVKALDGHCAWKREGGGKCEFFEKHAEGSPTMSPTNVWYKHTLTPTTPVPSGVPIPVPTAAPSNVPTTPKPSELPTPKPTDLPTLVPSPVPTKIPFPIPTKLPTPVPSPKPTDMPSPKPTHDPSPVPSPKPTDVPTPKPTDVPTPKPSDVPTPKPTRRPSSIPTPEPTYTPTPGPSYGPSPAPSKVPAPGPSQVPIPSPTPLPTTPQPSPKPTEVPSPKPTKVPSPVPSYGPSPVPTSKPTPKPTEVPSPKPTNEPSPIPTPKPTELPTPKPTDLPSPKPTPQPTKVPLPQPTSYPTYVPSPKPTLIPSPKPTDVPVPAPSASPSGIPIPAPTQKPTDVPSPKPSKSPTEVPSPKPSPKPSSLPSLLPIPRPTQKPTGVPIPSPSKSPTEVPSPKPSPKPTEVPSPKPSELPSPRPTADPTPWVACYVWDQKQECLEREHCFWDSEKEVQADGCKEKTCSQYTHEEQCDDCAFYSCRWDRQLQECGTKKCEHVEFENECFEYHMGECKWSTETHSCHQKECGDQKGEMVCKDHSECFWNDTDGTCEVAHLVKHCSMIYHEKECWDFEEDTCAWSRTDKQCHKRKCESHTVEYMCKEHSDCIWKDDTCKSDKTDKPSFIKRQ